MSEHLNPLKQNPQDDTPSPERRLTRRLLVRAVAVISIVMAGILLVGGWVSDRRHMTRALTDMNRQAAAVEGAIRSIMLDTTDRKHEHVQALIDGIGRDPSLIGLRVMTLDTVIAFSKNSGELGRKINLRQENPCASCHLDSEAMALHQLTSVGANGVRAYHYVLPIRNGPECWRCHGNAHDLRGILVADYSLDYYDKNMATARIEQATVLGVLLVLFVSFIYYFLQRAAYGPLAVVAGRLKRISRGDFSPHRASHRNDLIGYVNRQIDAASEHLRHLYEDMESRIEQRTHSLRQSQEALATEENKLRVILDNSPQGILWVSLDGSILFANVQAGNLLNSDSAALSGASVQSFDVLRQVFAEIPIKKMVERGSGALVTKHVGDSGSRTQYLETVWSGIATGDGRTPLLLMLTDITEKRGIEQNLERHERLAAVGQLAAGVAHEVGNPLSAISSLVQLSQKGNDPRDVTHNLDLVTYHIERISRIVRNLSDFARVPDERLLRCSISDIVRGAVEIASFDARAKEVTIDFHCSAGNPELSVRRDQLMQAILNVVLNAFDALRGVPEPKLTIGIANSDGSCTITIADNGHGISEEQIERVFEPFYTTKPVGEGTGLGLSVAYRIIADLDGEIEVESTVGQGTTFTIRLADTEKS